MRLHPTTLSLKGEAYAAFQFLFCITPEEIIWPHVQQLGDPKQKISADALCARLIVIKFIAMNSQAPAKLLLRYSTGGSLNAQSVSDTHITRVA